MKRLLTALGGIALGLTASFGIFLHAQDGPGPDGGGGPAGSAFATQYRTAAGAFGGTGPGTNGFVLTSRGAALSPTFQAAGAPTGAALTKGDDTNVTLTLGGAPTTSLLTAASITAGWTGQLALARGGTGLSAAADDTVPLSNGTSFAATAVTNCVDTGGNHLNYTAATNAFSCGTTSGGGATTGTGTFTFTDACTTDATQAFSYTLNSSVVTLFLGVMANCTSDSTNFLTAAGALPVAIRPSATLLIPSVEGTNNGSSIGLCYVLLADGTVAMRGNSTIMCASSGWTGAGTKRGPGSATAITYRLD